MPQTKNQHLAGEKVCVHAFAPVTVHRLRVNHEPRPPRKIHACEHRVVVRTSSRSASLIIFSLRCVENRYEIVGSHKIGVNQNILLTFHETLVF